MKLMPAVVCAGGHGKVLRPTQSKLGDKLEGKPILIRVVENLKAAGVFSQIVVVVNPLLGDELIDMMYDNGHRDIWVEYQNHRRGPADAVKCALRVLEQLGADNFFTVFGEMPFISPSSMREVAEAHATQGPCLTLLTCPHDVRHPLGPQLEKYTYLKVGWDNGHRREPFLYMYRPEPAEHGDDVLGSVYCFNRQWFTQNFCHIEAVDTKRDGFGAEYHLPKLVELAVRQGQPYCNVRKDNIHCQILGINTLEDYRVAEQAYRML